MSTTKETPVIKPETRTLADALKAGISIDPTSGAATVAKGIYEQNLRPGITMAQVKGVQDNNVAFVAGLGLALGELATPLMVKNKDLNKVEAEVTLAGSDKVTVAFFREREVNIPGKEAKTLHGSLSARMTVSSIGNRQEMTAVKHHLADLAEKNFK
jgi:hypothetical protein